VTGKGKREGRRGKRREGKRSGGRKMERREREWIGPHRRKKLITG